jgi:hypothetical protein
MFRSLLKLALAVIIFSTLAGCIVVDGHHGGGHGFWGHAQKGQH